LEYRKGKYMDIHYTFINAILAGYKFNIANIGKTILDQTSYLIRSDFKDVEVTRPNINTDLSIIDKRCLMSVNGFIYPTIFFNNKLYIQNANLSLLRSGENQIGLLSFNGLEADYVKYNITPDFITSEQMYSLYDKCIITFKQVIKTPILIIGGYIQLEEPNIFYRVSDNSFVLSLSKLNYIERLYESLKHIDVFNNIGIPTATNNPTMIDSSVAKSDQVIKNYLTTFNTFLIDLPTTNIKYNRIYLEHNNIIDLYRSDLSITSPVITGYGKLVDYISTNTIEGKYIIHTLNAFKNNYILSNGSINQETVINGARIIGNRYEPSNLFALDIYSTI